MYRQQATSSPPSSSTPPSPAPPASRPTLHRTAHRAWVIPLVVALVVGTAFVALYVGLQRNPQPSHLPVAATGQQLSQSLQSGLGDRVDVRQVADQAHGDDLVREGQVLGALTATAPGVLELDYAGAQGLSESSAVRAVAAGAAQRAGLALQERDLVPLVPSDGRGLVAFYTVFGVTLSSFVLAQGLAGSAARVRLRHRLTVVGGFAILIGVLAAVLVGPVFGAVSAPLLPLAATLALLSSASALGTKALAAWLGPLGIAVAVLVLTVVGNATSGATIGPDLLPGWARALSQVLPQGSAVQAVKTLSYFDGADAWPEVVLLASWAAVGLSLVILHGRLRAVPVSPTG